MPKQARALKALTIPQRISMPTCFIEKQEFKQVFKQVN